MRNWAGTYKMMIIWRIPKSTTMVRFEVKLERKKQMKAGFTKNSGPYKVPDPFEAKGLVRYEHRGLVDHKCSKKCSRSGLVSVYARLGLHRYNFLNGTNYKLKRVEKYNQSTGSAASSYFITLVAEDPTASSIETFQTRVNEECYGKLELSCPIARPRGVKPTCIGTSQVCHIPTLPQYDCLPECPPENPFDRFYKITKSELEDNDWIRLYLELAVATADRSTSNHDLSKLKILKVAMEDTSQEGVRAKNTVFYIRYLDLPGSPRVGKDVDRIAIIRRKFNELTCGFSLLGQNLSAQVLPKKSKNLSE